MTKFSWFGKYISVLLCGLFPLSMSAASPNIPDGTLSLTITPASSYPTVELTCDPLTVAPPAPCVGPTKSIVIPLVSGLINYSALQRLVFPVTPSTPSNSDRCPLTQMNCHINAPTTSITDFTISRLGKWADGSGGLAWSAQLSNVKSQVPDTLFAASQQATPVSGGYRTIGVQLFVGQDGRITLANNVPTVPAQLICQNEVGDSVTLTPQNATAAQPYFDLGSVFTQVAPEGSLPTTAANLSNCTLEDSAKPTPNVYATIPAINGLGTYNDMWGVSIPTLKMAPGNFLVTQTSTAPIANHPGIYNQYTITISPLTNGLLTFGGEITQVTDPLFVTCGDGKTVSTTVPVKNYTVDLYSLHGTRVAPNVALSYAQCALQTDPAKTPVTQYATFVVTGLQGTYKNAVGGGYMWAMNVTNIVSKANYLANALPSSTTTCDSQSPTMCNQIGINFFDTLPGSIDISSPVTPLPATTTLLCDGGLNFKGIPDTTGGFSFDLQALHGNVDPNTAVNFTKCKVVDGTGFSYGDFSINGISGEREDPSMTKAKMWAAQLTNLDKLTLIQSTNCDPSDTTYCNTWQLKISS